MRITEFEIDIYGPLAGTGSIKLGDFNLFFGRNENGKTLTIDALIKFLVGKKAKDFKADRVDGEPNGHVKILIGGDSRDRTEKTLPYDGDLPGITKSLPAPLSSSDFRNIFIIRNSEVFLSAEADFYTKVTERLVGLRTSDLKKIKKNLLEIGKLTPGMDFRDDEKSAKLKKRINRAAELITIIQNSKEKLLSGKYDTLEIDLYKKSNELAGINERIIQYEDARKRILFENSSLLLNNLENKISALKEMEIFREEDLEFWQDCEREIKRCEKELIGLNEKSGETKKEIAGVDDELRKSKQYLDAMNSRKRQLDEEKINIRNIQDSLSLVESDTSLRIILKRISIISSIITLAVFLNWMYNNPSVYLYFAGILSLLISLILWTYEIYLNLKKRKTLGEFKKIKLSLAENMITGDSVEDILNRLGKFNEDYEKARLSTNEFESRLMMLRRQEKETEQKIGEQRNLINDLEKKIFSLKTKSGFKSLQEYYEALKRKRNIEKDKDNIAGRLEGMLEVHGKSLGDILNLVRSKINELEQYRGKGEGLNFNENIFNDLKKGSRSAEEELQKIKEKMSQFATGMSKIESDIKEIFIENDDKLYCKTLVDLDEILLRLKNFISENNNKRDSINEILNIIDDIEKEEDEKVLKLFESKDAISVSGIFNMITDGYYNEVIYDRNNEGGILKVKRNNGEILDVEKLSGGAYDQLYLAVRLALGEKLLNSEKGFFIMDDPFIKSDIERIERQMNALKKICNIGWQILYFSCKNEIKDILSNDIKNGNITYIDIDWIK